MNYPTAALNTTGTFRPWGCSRFLRVVGLVTAPKHVAVTQLVVFWFCFVFFFNLLPSSLLLLQLLKTVSGSLCSKHFFSVVKTLPSKDKLPQDNCRSVSSSGQILHF